MQSTILPKKNTMPTLIVRYCNDVVAHNGRGITMQENRKTGSWIINYNTLVRKVIHNCGKCQSARVRFGKEIMADLPKDRVSESPSHCVKSVQIRSFFWSVFSLIRTEYGEIRSISRYTFRMREKTDQKKLRIWTLFTHQCHSLTVVSISFDPFLSMKDRVNWKDMMRYSHDWIAGLCTLK